MGGGWNRKELALTGEGGSNWPGKKKEGKWRRECIRGAKGTRKRHKNSSFKTQSRRRNPSGSPGNVLPFMYRRTPENPGQETNVDLPG